MSTSGAGKNAPTNYQSVPNKVEIPRDQSAPEQAASPVATLSSHVDPMPHYIMATGCGAASAYAYTRMNNPRAAGITGAFALAYLLAGRLVVTGHPRLGYDVGTLASVGLLGYKGPKAWNEGNTMAAALAAGGAISTVANGIKSYQYRTGKPHEMHEK